MAACPNCGRQTLRTKDWACQWCGYPLISRAFKSIDKTFKELQEERSRAPLEVDEDIDAVPGKSFFETETETAAEPEPETPSGPKQKPKFRLFRKRESIPQRPRVEPRPEPAPAPEPRPQRRPVFRRPEPPAEKAAPPEPVLRTEPEKPVYKPPPERAPEAKITPQPQVTPEPVIEAEPEPLAAAPSPIPEPPKAKPEIIVEPPPPPVTSLKLDDIKDGMEISINDLDALFRLDKSGTNMRINGKTVILKGIVEKVFIREHLEIRYIVVKGKGKAVWSARCTFEKENAAKASRLNEGQEVAVRAKYDGYGKNVIFKDCEVV